ncbi:MAG: hypothetical protein A3H96_25780 [Acidobacteria bacterium RIFCSPLOWO2_02_FULL_67_36]|nr:MAG: hypothetical protein A3H96_25780 [Acidobacteria bacterium RIFCSPLOWO2_02_FULL_67_36]OFW19588.1 MAG: hypothetical protein A3G21_21520 [Acidobacteria bacterium RIFCSPLOWO2_12_FULL_66_21]
MLGQTLGRFTILDELGRGGMGVVYKAHDTRLDRDVALKLLPPDRVADPERRRRFEQEAKAASALQHPNIVTIYDITREGDRDVIVMEYVPGSTLDRLIGRKGLRLGEALGYSVQIADGLSKAHAAGIVHRDLKPSNVMVSGDGTVKILDFGLAKLFEREPMDALAPTVTARQALDGFTDDGHIVGTAAYMSPEQAEGKKVDSRSDIFSFGSVLYEMVTGRRAFQRDTSTRTLSAIVAEEPEPAGRLVADLPPELERVLERCLRKDPQRRWQSVPDLRVVLQDLKEDSDSGKLRAVAPAAPRRSRWRRWVAAVAGFAVLAAALVWAISHRPRSAAGITVTRMTFDSNMTGFPTISQDGRLLAYASDRAQPGNLDIWIQQVAGGQPLRLTNHPAFDVSPSFSPDGSRIAFRSERDGGGIYVVDALGGDARRISDRGHFPLFSPDGSLICYLDIPASLDSALSRIYLVAAQGGPPQAFHPEFSVLGAALLSHPVWSPDGKSLLFLGRRGRDPSTADWWIIPLDGGPPVRVGAVAALSLRLGSVSGFPRVWTNDFVYYASGTTVEGVNLLRVPFDRARPAITGKPEPLTAGAGMKYNAALALDGRLVFPHMTWTLNIWSAAIQSDRGKATGELEPITRDETVKFSPRISRNGSMLAYAAFSGLDTRDTEIRIRNLTSGRETALPPFESTMNPVPVFSADGSVLAYRQVTGGRSTYYIRTPGSATDRVLCEDCGVYAFFTDPAFALVQYGPQELVRQNVSTGARTTVLHVDGASILDAQPSWDDRWVTYLLGLPSGNVAISVAPLRDRPAPIGDRILVREDDHILLAPRWSPNGEWLYYLAASDGFMCVWGQRLDAVSRKPSGAPVGILHLHGSRTMSFPLGQWPLEVASGRLIFTLGEPKSNIYMARLDRW